MYRYEPEYEKPRVPAISYPKPTFYYQPQGPSDEELSLLRLIDEQYLKTPFYGSRRMTVVLRQQGYGVNRKRVQRLMRQLGLEAIYPKPRLSQVHPEHQVYPYLLRNLAVMHANHVWCTDITYLPVLKEHFYLVAMIDWFSRKVLSWRISNTLDVIFCVQALQEAIAIERLKSSTRIRQPIHVKLVHRLSESGWGTDQHGWSWTVP